VVGPPDVAADPVGDDKQDASGDGDHAQADSGEEPDAGRARMLTLIHYPDAIAAVGGRDLRRSPVRGGRGWGLTGAPGGATLRAGELGLVTCGAAHVAGRSSRPGLPG